MVVVITMMGVQGIAAVEVLVDHLVNVLLMLMSRFHLLKVMYHGLMAKTSKLAHNLFAYEVK